MARIMGIDLGDVRTGIALSDPSEFMASGICTVTEYTEERLLARLLKLIEEHRPVKLVLGLPINMDGSEGFRAEKVRTFGEKLKEASGLPLIYCDERCSTMVAHTVLNETNTRGKKRKQVVDILSAEIILQSYLDKNRKKV